MARRDTVFACQTCDYQAAKWLGRCPECGAWGSFSEKAPTHRSAPRDGLAPRPQPLSEIGSATVERRVTGIDELDRVLGGGLVPGAVILIGGEPGVGKSTLVLQAASALAAGGGTVLYASGEESAAQLRLRGERLGVGAPSLLVVAETDVDLLVETARQVEPDLLIVDSIQAVRCAGLDSLPGSVAQVRESANRFTSWAKGSSRPVLLIGHVTKEGAIAGPRALEHLVDTVIQFEGDRHHAHRILRALKNRFGPSDELGVFRMGDRGLVEVSNPSELLLSERSVGSPGSAVLPAVEGTRPLLVEIQALVGHPVQGTPRRTALGIDSGRVAMLLAVIQKETGLDLVTRDVFVNVTGGISVVEPASDLAVSAAIVSSARQEPLPPGWVIFGEIGLTGELRAVAQVESRLKEAARLGFSHALMPRGGASTEIPGGLRAIAADSLRQGLKSLFDKTGA